MSTPTTPARPDRASAAAAVAEDLARVILTQMAPGSSLPSEAELAERYAVSRLTIREAVKLLAGRGLVELARGKKALVREPDGKPFADFLTSMIRSEPKGLFDLIEVRLSLEVQSATLAAKRASRAGLIAIESALEGMRTLAARDADLTDEADERRFNQFDAGFHEAIALASGNRALGYLFEAMAGPLQEGSSSAGGAMRHAATACATPSRRTSASSIASARAIAAPPPKPCARTCGIPSAISARRWVGSAAARPGTIIGLAEVPKV